MRISLDSLDISRLSGRRAVLGIDITSRRARVVELRRKGEPFLKQHAKFAVQKTMTCEFPGDATNRQKGEFLHEALDARGVGTRIAVTSIRSFAVKTVAATIPEDTEDTNGWIVEHAQKLLKLPISPSDLVFRYEPIEMVRTGMLVDVVFVRKSDVEQQSELITSAGLELIGLSAGSRDLVNALLLQSANVSGNISFVHLGEEATTATRLANGRRDESMTQPAGLGQSMEQRISGALSSLRKDEEGMIVFVAGDQPDIPMSRSYSLLTPLGLEPHFALASSLAVKGLLPDISPIDLLSPARHDDLETQMHRSLFQRTALALGSALLALLLLPYLANIILQQGIESVDERAAASSAAYADVKALEQEVAALEGKVEESPGSLHRTNSARVLHEIAGAVPEGVWLSRATIGGKDPGATSLVLKGKARSASLVTVFLRNLRASGVCTDEKIVRIGGGTESEGMVPVASSGSSGVGFEIAAGLKM